MKKQKTVHLGSVAMSGERHFMKENGDFYAICSRALANNV